MIRRGCEVQVSSQRLKQLPTVQPYQWVGPHLPQIFSSSLSSRAPVSRILVPEVRKMCVVQRGIYFS